MTNFVVGSGVVLSAAATHNDDIIDSALYTLKIKPPDGEIETIEGTDLTLNDDDTRYEYTYQVTMAGQYYYRFEIADPFPAAEEKSFHVAASQFE